jgi:beta-lactamase regulating signal transducer with metallopeptidase domain
MIAALLDHIWQSTAFAGAAALLTLAFRRNGAGTRFWLWFAASLKFLLPFTILAALGETLSQLFPSALPRIVLAIPPTAEKLSAPAQMLVAPQSAGLMHLLLLLWLLGFAALLCIRLLRWLRLRAVIAAASDVDMLVPVRVKSSPSLLEPGLVGIVRPVVLLPQGLMARLSEAERNAILAHELGHLSRRDNITAAIHMLVETLFWFWPPVWLIGARLIAERERACDESVLAAGHDPEVYAGGILKVCKFCIQSPLACAAGVSGADLARRVRQIMTDQAALDLGGGRRLLLAGAAALALMLPVTEGFLASPFAVEVQKKVAVLRAQVAASVVRHVAVAEDRIGIASMVPVRVRRLPRQQAVAVAITMPILPPEVEPAPLPKVAVTPPPEPDMQPVPTPPAKQEILALYPQGVGDPDAITCRAPQPLPASRLPGPAVCKTNRVWAALRAGDRDIGPDGTTMVATVSRGPGTFAPAGGCYAGTLLPSVQTLNIPASGNVSVCR